jgi:hypothetical protein
MPILFDSSIYITALRIGSQSVVQSEQELREFFIAKDVKREEIEGHLAELKRTGEITIIV